MNTNKRISGLDLTKTFIIVISMIGIHTMYHLADLEPTGAVNVLNVLATDWGAPVFMFCMGLTLTISSHRGPTEWFHRGFHLLTIGMALNVLRYVPMAFRAHATATPELYKELAQVFTVDILQFAGMAFMLLALLKKMKVPAWSVYVIALLMNVCGTLLIGHYTRNYVVNQMLGYFYHTPTCSCFPLMNWFIFVAAGNMLGRILLNYADHDRLFRYLLPIFGTIAIVHQYLSITGKVPFFKTLQSDWDFYSMETPDALCVAFGVAPFMVSFFRWIGKIIPKKVLRSLSYPSLHINQFYCVSWVWIMWIASFLFFIEPATTFAAFVLWWISLVALTSATVVVYNKFLKSRIEPFFRKNATVCNIGVWVAIIAFGIWYFCTIPGPYIMPY